MSSRIFEFESGTSEVETLKSGSPPCIQDFPHNAIEFRKDASKPKLEALSRGSKRGTTFRLWQNAAQLQWLKGWSSGFGTEYWKLQNLAFLHQLKEVTMQYSDDGSNEIEFSTYILKNAQNLKKIVIFLGCEDEQSKAARMVSRIKMISTATIIIRRRE
ncbi:Hypothetical predicted protein [Prunus dulcis]|uniref:FBD domain-containing protein n=1 Tax=Prunus dulcis TaxID=3755 RepID=A0A5E4EIH9_PRUDU|nr:Hypothetical predicted protein [Prunus dulcis]